MNRKAAFTGSGTQGVADGFVAIALTLQIELINTQAEPWYAKGTLVQFSLAAEPWPGEGAIHRECHGNGALKILNFRYQGFDQSQVAHRQLRVCMDVLV